MSGPRPAAITTHSASPDASPYLNVTDASPDTTSLTNTPLTTSIPCFLKPRSASLEISVSSVGSTRSSASNSCVLTPSRAYADAISDPDAPDPITASDDGSSLSAHASSVPSTRPPNEGPGSGRFTEPVASTIVLADSVCGPTLTWPPPISVPTPSTTSIEFFFIRPETPPVRGRTTFSRRAITAPQ